MEIDETHLLCHPSFSFEVLQGESRRSTAFSLIKAKTLGNLLLSKRNSRKAFSIPLRKLIMCHQWRKARFYRRKSCDFSNDLDLSPCTTSAFHVVSYSFSSPRRLFTDDVSESDSAAAESVSDFSGEKKRSGNEFSSKLNVEEVRKSNKASPGKMERSEVGWFDKGREAWSSFFVRVGGSKILSKGGIKRLWEEFFLWIATIKELKRGY